MPLCLLVVMEKTQKCLAREDVSVASVWNESRCFLLSDGVRGPLCVTPLKWLKSVPLRLPVPGGVIQCHPHCQHLIMKCCVISGFLSGGKADWTASWEGRRPGWTLSLWHGLRGQQGEGCVWRSDPLRIQLPGQRLCHLGNHWVNNFWWFIPLTQFTHNLFYIIDMF